MRTYVHAAVILIFPLLLCYSWCFLCGKNTEPTHDNGIRWGLKSHAEDLLRETKNALLLKNFLQEQGIECDIEIRETKGPYYRTTFKLKEKYERTPCHLNNH